MKRIFYNKIFVVILLLGISISLHARSENLLNNSDLTVLRPTSEVVKEMRNLKVVTNSDKIPVYWMPRSGNSQTVTYSAGDGKIILNSSFPVFLNCSRESREVPEFIVPTLIEKNTNFFG